MAATVCDVVTGAFGYTGRYITQRLIAQGRHVRTLTRDQGRPNPFGAPVTALPLEFERPDELAGNLAGADTLYNTYWVRFAHSDATFGRAIEHTRTLVGCALRAGVRRLVHISITNPALDSPLPYFRGKAEVEEFIAGAGLPYAIIRPTVIFGREDILINNIAWLLRKLPVFALPGRGGYRLQPVSVEDVARLAVEAGQQEGNVVMDAVGPETFAFADLVRLIARAVGSRARVISAPPWMARGVAAGLGWLMGDVMLTRDELAGLTANLLVSGGAPTGTVRFGEWLAENAAELGRTYRSELRRHFRAAP